MISLMEKYANMSQELSQDFTYAFNTDENGGTFWCTLVTPTILMNEIPHFEKDFMESMKKYKVSGSLSYDRRLATDLMYIHSNIQVEFKDGVPIYMNVTCEDTEYSIFFEGEYLRTNGPSIICRFKNQKFSEWMFIKSDYKVNNVFIHASSLTYGKLQYRIDFIEELGFEYFTFGYQNVPDIMTVLDYDVLPPSLNDTPINVLWKWYSRGHGLTTDDINVMRFEDSLKSGD